MLPEGDGEPAEVIISVWDHSSAERDFRLSLGQSFEFAGQTWRLDEIDDESHQWYATLTRVA
jgi:cytochrome c biogenesis factor